MRKCLLCLSILASSLYPSTVQPGGSIPAINTVECRAAETIDFTKRADDLPILQCRINNNAQAYQVELDFGRLTAFRDLEGGGSNLTGLTLHEVGGNRGEGLADPSGMDVLPLLRGNRFTWSPGRQTTSTRDYVVEFRASWKGSKLSKGKGKEKGPIKEPVAGSEVGPVWAAMTASL